jgi:hypothetical protein
MRFYAKIENAETKTVSIGTGTNTDFYTSIGMTLMDVEQGYDGQWYVAGHAPVKPQELIDAETLAAAKAERAAAVAALTVEVDGMTFDGDEKAQERMSRAVNMADSPDECTEWVLADSTVAVVTAAQLRRACRAAGKAQTALWVKPYQN